MTHSNSTKDLGNLVLNEESLLLADVHYFHNASSMGTDAVLKYNEKGWLTYKPNIKTILVGDGFDDNLFQGYEKRQVDLKGNFSENLTKKLKDTKYVIIENPFRNLEEFPNAPQEYKKFSEENPDKIIVYRHHDVDNKLKNAIPNSENVKHVTLIEETKEQLKQEYGINASILKNSVVCENFNIPDPKKDNLLRQVMEEKGFIMKGQDIFSCPNRIVDRKNIEEMMLVTKILNKFHGWNLRLVVTTSIEKENNPFQQQYAMNLRMLEEKHRIPCTFGGVSEILDDKIFGVGNLYRISKLAGSGSWWEGYCYGFVEPWVAGVPLVGRDVPRVRKDFEKNGLKLGHLWGDETFANGPNYKIRVEYIDKVLSNENLLLKTANKFNLPKRIADANKVIEINKNAIEKNYNHKKIAGNLLDLLEIPY